MPNSSFSTAQDDTNYYFVLPRIVAEKLESSLIESLLSLENVNASLFSQLARATDKQEHIKILKRQNRITSAKSWITTFLSETFNAEPLTSDEATLINNVINHEIDIKISKTPPGIVNDKYVPNEDNECPSCIDEPHHDIPELAKNENYDEIVSVNSVNL